MTLELGAKSGATILSDIVLEGFEETEGGVLARNLDRGLGAVRAFKVDPPGVRWIIPPRYSAVT